jgi:stage III sporulation protein SpoIIIAA
MIKSVAQAIPTYAMGCFDLTKELCDQISSLICGYWWSQNDKENKNALVELGKKMKMSKKQGGMGFRDIHSFNIMLAKQGWRIAQTPNSLCARVLKTSTSIIVISYRPNQFLACYIHGGVF